MGFFFNYLSGFGFRELLIFDFSCQGIMVHQLSVMVLLKSRMMHDIFCYHSYLLSNICLSFVFSSFCLLFFSVCLLFPLSVFFFLSFIFLYPSSVFSILFFVVMMLIINSFWEMSDFCLFYCLLLFFLVLGISYFFF